jgi:hypothetical protein
MHSFQVRAQNMVSKYEKWLPGGHCGKFQKSKVTYINLDCYLKDVCDIKTIHPWHLGENVGNTRTDGRTRVNTRIYHLVNQW